MTPQRCIATSNEEGDCWRASLASILNLPAQDVPNFVFENGSEYVEETRRWLADRGLGLFQTYCDDGWTLDQILKWFQAGSPDIPAILCGRSGRDPTDNHAVVIMNGEIVHDPSNSGVTGGMPMGCDCCKPRWYLYVVAFADASRLAA